MRLSIVEAPSARQRRALEKCPAIPMSNDRLFGRPDVGWSEAYYFENCSGKRRPNGLSSVETTTCV